MHSFLLQVSMAWLEKKSYPLNEANFLTILLFAHTKLKEPCSLENLDFPNSLPLLSISLYSAKPFPQSACIWHAPGKAEKVSSVLVTFCLAYTNWNNSVIVAGLWIVSSLKSSLTLMFLQMVKHGCASTVCFCFALSDEWISVSTFKAL